MKNREIALFGSIVFLLFLLFFTILFNVTSRAIYQIETDTRINIIEEEISHLGFVNPMPIEEVMARYRNADWLNTNYENLDYWQKYSDQFNVDKNLMLAISIWETGNFTSDNWFNNYNPSGITCEIEYDCASNGFIKFNSVESGIYRMAQKLREEYINLGLDTISLIGSKWCPVGAKNDPKGINKYWINGVTKIYNELESKLDE